VLGAAAGATAATALLPQQGANTAATTVLPAGAAVMTETEEEVEEQPQKKRSPWTWPLIVLIALLALVLIGTLIALAMNNGGNEPDPTKSTPAVTTTTPPPPATTTEAPPPTSEAPTTVQVNRDDYIGRNVDEVRGELVAAGLVVNTQQGGAATEPSQANTVTDVNPSGPLPIGSTVTVTYLGAPETPSAPGAGPSVNPSEVAAGGIVQVSWPAATCPSGQQLSGYEVAVTGDAVAPSPVGAGTTSVNVQAGQEPFEVTYRYFCGQLDSPFSPATAVSIAN